MALVVEIAQVSAAVLNKQELWGFAIDRPAVGDTSPIWGIRLKGWVLGKRGPVTHVDVLSEGVLCRSVPVVKARPDVARKHAGVAGADRCGFETVLGAIGLPREFAVHLRARWSDGSSVLLGSVRGERRPLKTRFQPRLQPLMVTTLGRSGSTWLMCLLGQHPGIVVERRFPFETLAASYWMHMLKVLAEPANLEQSSHPATFRRNRWQIGHNPFFQESLSGQIPPARRSAAYWLGRRYVMDLASFCQRSIDSYYRRVGRGQAQHKACFFVEKFEPGHVPNMIWELYPEAREVILIRDFRDQLCSILSLNARRGYAAFGRDRVGSDEEYVSWLGRATLHLLKSWRRRSGQAHLVRYEDLVFRPETTIASLLGYLQLDPAPEIIHGMMEQAAAGTPELARHATVPDPRASVGRWQRDLSPVFQALCADTFGDLLREFGYSVAGDDGTAASPGGG